MNNNENFASHIEVKNALVQMEKCGGAPLMPLSLYPFFYRLLSEEELQRPNPIILARSYAYTFCAICNEYFVIYRKSKFPKKEFFMSEERWKKYCIIPDIREKGIEFLQRIDLITCDSKIIPPDNQVERTFKINLATLNLFTKAVEEIYQEAQSAKYPF